MKHGFIFGYGSLINPASLSKTLPEVSSDVCVPAFARGFVRTWTVAFPNLGTQRDKSYYDAKGHRHPFVLFANLDRISEGDEVAGGRGANGILIPVSEDRIARLTLRERRYRLIDIGDSVDVHPSSLARTDEMRVSTFVGRPRFSRPEDVARGVVSREYKECVEAGAEYWEGIVPGFQEDYERSTLEHPGLTVEPLIRVDHFG